MARIAFEGMAFEGRPAETVLDALLRHGLDLPFSCRKGVCQTCLLQARSGALPPKAQQGLKETLAAQGYFLPCVCVPEADLDVVRPDAEALFVPAEVVAVERLSPKIARLRLRPDAPFDYRPGQFLNLRRADGVTRSYSLASVPGVDRWLELHVQRSLNGTMSPWICDTLAPGARVLVQGPNGASFYVPGRPQQPLLLIGTGSGLAPLYGIARDALQHGHSGRIELYHGTRRPEGHYLTPELRALAKRCPNFAYVACLSGAERAKGSPHGRADDLALKVHPDLAGWRVFLAGNAAMVAKARKAAYLAGAALADIHADPFEKKDLRRFPRRGAAAAVA